MRWTLRYMHRQWPAQIATFYIAAAIGGTVGVSLAYIVPLILLLIGGCKALFSGGNKGLVYKMVVLCHDYWLHRIRHDVRFKRLFYSREQIVRKQRKDDSRKTSEEKAMTMPKKN